MPTNFDLENIFIVNLFGCLLICLLLFTSRWRFKDNSEENKNLTILMICSLSNCIADPLSYLFIGHPGQFARIFIAVSTSWLYVSIMLTSFYWLRFLAAHLKSPLSQLHNGCLFVAIASGIFLLCINFIEPLSFSLDDNNFYHRETFYNYFLCIDYGILIDSIIFYFCTRLRGGVFKSFPLWAYLLPAIIGGSVQTFFYGNSVLSVSLAISLAGILVSLQNEKLFRDQESGLYNRNYLNFLQRVSAKIRPTKMTAILLTVHDFRKINLSFPQNSFIQNFAQMLKTAVGDRGNSIHCDGDEFLILITSQENSAIENCLQELQSEIDKFNFHNASPYLLAIDYDIRPFDFSQDSFIQILQNQERKLFNITQ